MKRTTKKTKEKEYDFLEDAQKKAGATSSIFSDIKSMFGKLSSIGKSLKKL